MNNWCYQQQPPQLMLEMGSQVAVKMIQGQVKPPWKLRRVVDEVQKKIFERRFHIKHCYRKANAVADSLVKPAILQRTTRESSSKRRTYQRTQEGP